jgi:peptide-methionine (R)-S-oxide reductase
MAAFNYGDGPRQAPANQSGETSTDEEPPEKIVKTQAEWRKLLTAEQFEIARLKGTEAPYTGRYWQTKKDGVYRCACCGRELFDARAKFDSGTGWPSFWQPVSQNAVEYHEDRSEEEFRIEVTCSRCDAHLGHVFRDGPEPTGLRFCMNSASLTWVDRDGKTEKQRTGKGKSSSSRNKKRP